MANVWSTMVKQKGKEAGFVLDLEESLDFREVQ